ncbi:PREDICTED: probable receptor-like protein kinase At5g24010 [Nicotiana attenuata]|uniref:Receptor-like protein kinase n=1 Tax=Nicotiana attenuata TaxID=49451 RepID=A0A1J6IT79_NICAT|nr:PREDICTED: probable receptor-like protein kinase At5g24010 [Nicotiana attenuata]OIT08054.1 putative receptor-like protein kinase [Nicotiana attenuata]
MATLFSTLALYFSFTFLCFHLIAASFSPIDHYLINCGSHEPKTVDSDHRHFSGDSTMSFLASTGTISLTDANRSPKSSPIYHTARVFTRPSKYKFLIKNPGTHLLRLHFRRLISSSLDFNNAKFHVLANGFVLFNSLSIEMGQDIEIVKDYVIGVDSDVLVISFVPIDKSKFAFVNGIEVISAPNDLIADVAQYVSFDKNEQIHGLLKNGFETVYRVNVGGWKVTPFNDSLWRTWVTDDEYLKSKDGSSKVHFGGRINYQDGGASREVGPDNVYNSARVIRSSGDSVSELNMTWTFPVIGGYKYLVRMHFCDIASIARGMLFFDVYVNDNLAYKNLDLTSVTNGMLASPFYADVVVDGDSSGVLTLSVGPSNMSLPRAVDAILNGVEIMKINNSVGSFDGEICAHSVLKSWKKGNGSFYPMLAAVFLLLIAFVIMHRRRAGATDSGTWWSLPTEIPEVNMKYSNQMSSNKL